MNENSAATAYTTGSGNVSPGNSSIATIGGGGDQHLRRMALDLAVPYARDAADAVARATAFLAFLKGEEAKED